MYALLSSQLSGTQRSRDARSALAAAEEDHARGDGLKPVDGVLIQGGDLLVLGEGCLQQWLDLPPLALLMNGRSISFTYQSGMRSREGGARSAADHRRERPARVAGAEQLPVGGATLAPRVRPVRD